MVMLRRDRRTGKMKTRIDYESYRAGVKGVNAFASTITTRMIVARVWRSPVAAESIVESRFVTAGRRIRFVFNRAALEEGRLPPGAA